MDPDRDEEAQASDQEDLNPLSVEEEEEEQEEEEEEEEEDEEEDAKIFNAWMQRYRTGECQRKAGEEKEEEKEEKEEGEAEGSRASSRASRRTSFELSVPLRSGRRMSLPCPATLSAMQLNRLHSSTQAPVSAKALLCRSSSRRLLPSPQEAGHFPTRRASLITTIPEATATLASGTATIPEAKVPIHEATKSEKRSQFRRRKAMSLSDADTVCLICHNDLSQGASGTRELQCTHTFHRECIEEWLWRKQHCPTCHVQVSMPQPLYWNSTRVKVP